MFSKFPWLGCGVGIAALFIAGLVFLAVSWSNSPAARAGKELPSVLAKAKALGFPMSAQDMPSRPKIKPEDNAAPILRDVAETVLQAYGYHQMITIEPSGQRRHRRQADMQATYDSILKKTLLAADKPSCDFGLDWDAVPWELPLRQVDAMRAMCDLLMMEGVTAVRKGDFAVGLTFATRLHQLGEGIAETPLEMTVAVGFDAQLQACDLLNRLVVIAAHDTGKLKQIRTLLDQWTNTIPIEPALRGEFYFTLALGRNVTGFVAFEGLEARRGLKIPRPKPIVRSGEPSGLLVRGMVAKSLKSLIAIEEELKTQPSDVELLAYFSKSVGFIQSSGWRLSPESWTAMSKFGGLHYNRMKITALRRCLKLLVSTLITRNEKGHLPENLSAVGPGDVDPFSGKPLKMILNQDTLRIYSVGQNGKDDLGIGLSWPPPRGGMEPPPGDDVVAFCLVK